MPNFKIVSQSARFDCFFTISPLTTVYFTLYRCHRPELLRYTVTKIGMLLVLSNRAYAVLFLFDGGGRVRLPLWSHIVVMVFHSTDHSCVCWKACYGNNIWTIKALHHCPFGAGLLSEDSPLYIGTTPIRIRSVICIAYTTCAMQRQCLVYENAPVNAIIL